MTTCSRLFIALSVSAFALVGFAGTSDAGCRPRVTTHRVHQHVAKYVPPPAPRYYVREVPAITPPSFEPSPCEDYDMSGLQQQQAAATGRDQYRYQPLAYPSRVVLPPQAYVPASVAIWYSYHGLAHSLKVYGLNDFNPNATPVERAQLAQRNGVFLTMVSAQSFGKVDLQSQVAATYRWIAICDVDTGMAWVGPSGIRYALVHGQAPCTVTVGSAQTTCTPGT